jgi:hypothetical protein
MPYVKQEARNRLDFYLGDKLPKFKNAGELNYFLTKIVTQYFRYTSNYQAIAEVTGVLENVKQEFYRRVASPYENEKIRENGDVY